MFSFLGSQEFLTFLQESVQISDCKSGLSWRNRPQSHFKTEKGWKSFNTAKAGKPAGCLKGGGYFHFAITFREKTVYLRHNRVVMALKQGFWPSNFVDHRSGVRGNNAPANLRCADDFQNAQNARVKKHSSSGLKGAIFYKRTGKWISNIRVGGKRKHLGYFDTPEAANVAYAEAAKKFNGEFARAI